jgi:hypothetical protein
MNDEFLEPTPASRRKLALLFVAAVGSGAFVIELLKAYEARLQLRPVCESVEPVLVMWAACLGALVLAAVWVAWLARRALKLNQWPLPGTWVFHRTQIYRGPQVVWRAYAMFAWAALVVALVAFASYLTWQLVHRAVIHCESRVGMQPNNVLERTGDLTR